MNSRVHTPIGFTYRKHLYCNPSHFTYPCSKYSRDFLDFLDWQFERVTRVRSLLSRLSVFDIVYLFIILACTEMSLEEAPLKGKWRLNMSRLRLWNQYVFEQMGSSIDSGWSKWLLSSGSSSGFSQKAQRHKGHNKVPAKTTHSN